MSKPELGTKRICPTTGRKFYDLNKNPIVSPYTGEILPQEALEPVRRVAPLPVRAGAEAVVEDEVLADDSEVELISLEDAEENDDPTKDLPDDDIEIEADESEDTFLEEEEDEDADVTDLIGDGIAGDEEA